MSTDNSTCDLEVQEALVATGLTMQFPDGKIIPLASMECPSEDVKKILEQVVSSSDSDSQGASKGGFRWNLFCHAKVMKWFSYMGAMKGMAYAGAASITFEVIKEIANQAGITQGMSQTAMIDKLNAYILGIAGVGVLGSVGNVLATFTPINYSAYVKLYNICHTKFMDGSMLTAPANVDSFGGRKARKSRKYRKTRKARKSRRY
jgi:hypothetical protein